MRALFFLALMISGFICLAGAIEGLEQAFGMSPWLAVPIAVFILPSGVIPVGFALYGMIEGWHWQWYWAALSIFWPLILFGLAYLAAASMDAIARRREPVFDWARPSLDTSDLEEEIPPTEPKAPS